MSTEHNMKPLININRKKVVFPNNGVPVNSIPPPPPSPVDIGTQVWPSGVSLGIAWPSCVLQLATPAVVKDAA
jgi:hypothetical protein